MPLPNHVMIIHLAPMEGVLDSHMRALFTGMGGYSHCVTEFIRVQDKLLPDHMFYRYCPELQQQGRTPSGIPVIVQLLGGIPEMMAINAQQAVRLGAPAIDINFGCPSPTVNRHAGGAVLLKETQRVYAITHAVRNAVPAHIPVSAKIRLGYENTELTLDNALAVQAAGANHITVHARTKVDGYKPPARWEWLAQIRDTLTIPVIANGDINSVAAYQRCYAITGCEQIMLGRGALAQPDLARQIQHTQQGKHAPAAPWQEIFDQFCQLANLLPQYDTCQGRFVGARLKQWLAFLKLNYSEAQHLLDLIRPIKDYQEILLLLKNKESAHSTYSK